MRTYRHIEDVCGRESGCVLAVGNFDGLHRGHQKIFSLARAMAEEQGSPFAILTFTEHTARQVRPGKEPPALMTVRDRLRLAQEFGVDAALMLPFDESFAAMTPDQFVERILIACLNVSGVVAGTGWRFGRGRSGDMDLLARMGENRGFRIRAVEPLLVDGKPVSSTRVRQALTAGDVALAARLLGRPHFVRGDVVPGEGRGRGLGFPTVNLDCRNLMLPAQGVYAAHFQAGDSRGAAAVNVGTRPTFGGGALTVEAHLVGIDRDLYGREVTLSFLSRVRPETGFADPGELKKRIGEDVALALRIHDQWLQKEKKGGV